LENPAVMSAARWTQRGHGGEPTDAERQRGRPAGHRAPARVGHLVEADRILDDARVAAGIILEDWG
jgi:hypothetical protein